MICPLHNREILTDGCPECTREVEELIASAPRHKTIPVGAAATAEIERLRAALTAEMDARDTTAALETAREQHAALVAVMRERDRWADTARRMAAAAREWRAEAEIWEACEDACVAQHDKRMGERDHARALLRMLLDGRCPECGGLLSYEIKNGVVHDTLGCGRLACDFSITRDEIRAEIGGDDG